MSATSPPVTPPLDLPPAGPDGPLVTAIYADKGGVGKSTIATELAYELAQLGEGKIALIDVNAEQQESSSSTVVGRLKVEAGFDCVVEDDPSNLARVRQIRRRHIILDLPPSPREAEHGIGQAHVVLIPVFPEFLGTRAVMETVRRILPSIGGGNGPTPVLVFSRIDPQAVNSPGIRNLRAGFEGMGVRVAETVLRQYRAHSHAQANGIPLTAAPEDYDRGDKAAADVKAFATEYVAMTRKAFA